MERQSPLGTHSLLHIAVVVLALVAAAAAHQQSSPYFYEAQIAPATIHEPIMLTIHGKNFSTTTAVRLAGNATGTCNEGSTYASVDIVPPGTVSNVARWSETGSRSMWIVRLRVAKAQSRVLVCFTTDGRNWQRARNAVGQSAFRVWSRLPHARAVPWTLSKGATARFVLSGPFIAQSTRGALVNESTGCQGTSPAAVIPGGEVVPIAGANTLSFTPRIATSQVFLCVAEAPYNTWTLVPIDTFKKMTHTGDGNFPNDEQLDSLGVQIWPTNQRHQKATFSCTTLIGGASAACEIRVFNKTALKITPSTVAIEELLDGGGKPECPLPTLHAVGTAGDRLGFTWTPQNWGREGTLRLRYKGMPLIIDETAANSEYYEWSEVRNATYKPRQIRQIPQSFRDNTVTHFFVQPPFSHLDNYDYKNLVDFNYFAPKTNFMYQYGIMEGAYLGRQNGTIHKEMLTATLRKGVAVSSTMSSTVAIPAQATRCRASVYYYFAPEATDLDVSALIGTVVVAVTDGVTDLASRTFNLYSLGRKVIVTGGIRRNSLDGDLYTFEQLMHEISIISGSYKFIRMGLTIDPTQNPRLYFADPRVKCAVNSPRTDYREVAELKRLYASFTVTAGTPLASWKTATGLWNGDPCANGLWDGVTCRHYRVVGLNLANNRLFGTVPSLDAFEMLETLDLSNNLFQGALHLNNSRLLSVDITNNRFTSVSFELKARTCVHTVKAPRNVIAAFPKDVTMLPQLRFLDLSRNNMKGTMPHFPAERNIEVLHVADNRLVDSLPQLPSRRLRSLDLSMNRFNGSIPSAYGTMQNLRLLDLSKNALTGVLPVELGRVRTAPQLVLRAEDNYLSGFLPRLPVRQLDVRNNFFRCPLPTIDTYTNQLPEEVVGVLTVMDCDQLQRGEE